ncbi:MAG TPA: hypothetical protein DCL77_16460 [Prolixibacteraceae bacterium]|nr:hypothetical protein [Prolixibacteraceae bacterium]
MKPGYRTSQVKSHIIFYRRAEDTTVEEMRILHQMMDLENNLT